MPCTTSGSSLSERDVKPATSAKDDGHDFPLPFDGASRGEDFFGQVLRGVGLGLLVVDYWGLFGLT